MKAIDPIGRKTLDIMNQAGNYNSWLFGQYRPDLQSPVVEVGAGTGTFSKKMAAAGLSVTALDTNSQYLSQIKDAETIVFDLQSKSLPRLLYSRFNSALATNVLEHIADQSQALQNLYQMLIPSGKLVILVPAHQFAFGTLDKSLGHVRRYSQSSLKRSLIHAGFKVLKSKYLNFPGLFGWWFSSRILHRSVIPAWQVKLFDIFFWPWLVIEKYLPLPCGLSVLCVAQKD